MPINCKNSAPNQTSSAIRLMGVKALYDILGHQFLKCVAYSMINGLLLVVLYVITCKTIKLYIIWGKIKNKISTHAQSGF